MSPIPPATATTERLILRRPRLDDAEAVFERWASDAEVARYDLATSRIGGDRED